MSFYGIPPLAPGALANFLPSLAIAVASDIFFPNLAAPVWGIFDDTGNEAIQADSFVSFEYRNEWRVSDYPQEQGAFASYNKVNTPFDVRIRLAKGGTDVDRALFLNALELIAQSLNLYTVVTPERTYANVNIDHVDYKRENQNGVTLISADLWLREIRIANAAQFSGALPADQVQSTSAADPVSQGQVQTYSVPLPNVTVTTL